MVQSKQTLSPKELAEALGVSESSLKRWADAGRVRVVRTPGGHRRISVAEAVRFLRDANLSVVRPSLLGMPELDEARQAMRSQHDLGELLYERMMAGEAQITRGLVMGQYLSGASVAQICDGLLRHALQRIGEVWRHDARGIFLEHRATEQCLAALHQLARIVGEDREVDDGAVMRPCAVGGSPQGDPYLVPSLMAACTLMESGWHAINLGANVPLDALVQAARFYDASLLWLSGSASESRMPAVETLNALATRMDEENRVVVVGGRQFESLAVHRHENLHHCRSMAEFSAFARGLQVRAGDEPRLLR